jgi:hypothetical protein
MEWIDLAQGRDRWRSVIIAAMNFRIPQNAGSFLTSLGTVSFSGRTVLRGVGLVS